MRLTGRLKEIINRGGEKVSPKEVDEILMDYPAIAQVVTFGIPHEKLGEEVGVRAEKQESAVPQLAGYAAACFLLVGE